MTGRPPAKKDLVVLVADKDMEQALCQILARHQSLQIRPIDFKLIRYVSKRDPGCYGQSHNLLRTSQREFEHALVVFDHEGSGQEPRDVSEVEEDVADRLRRSGWGDKAAVVVIVPELEAWIWGRSRQVEQTLGWRDQPAALREWLQRQGLWPEQEVKPLDPKAAMETALRQLRRPWSSAIFAELASRVSFRHCRDRSFCRLVQILRSWFPPTESPK